MATLFLKNMYFNGGGGGQGRIYTGASGSMAPSLRYQGSLLKVEKKKSGTLILLT